MGVVYTLKGPVDAADLGPVLPHEHMPMHYEAWEKDDFEPGSKGIVREWYGPVLDDLTSTPFRTMVEVSPIGHGRDVSFRKELVGDRDLNVVLCTGCYLDSHQPEWVKERSAEELAEIFVRELEEGIDETDVRAGIIKLAPDASSGQSRKVCRAAALASKRTNARITTHSCSKNRETFDLLSGFGVAPESIYVGHADFAEFEENEYVCKKGGHVLFTVWDVDFMIPDELMYKRFSELARAGYVKSMLMSVDFAIMVHKPAEPIFLSWTLYGVEERTHSYLFKTVIPKLKEKYGFSEEEIRIITEENPRRMLDFRE